MARILYVEDDENVRDCTELMLKREGHTVISRVDTEKAFAIADLWKPHLVITDHDLGEGKENGLQLALRLNDAGVKVAMLSGNGDALSDAREAKIPFFHKPYYIYELIEEMKVVN